ncbi:hypothetical protein BJ138DRAFT_1182187 [Hygrophoropsis aurantiaca]|uniref:Uncharacterized protein n=1 Tax=Hygrophoropsis aurantiaca TaxID=72124 RepID=A0ACB8A418_9AGAM|nr:hypothetical protein BJ138DRAFT_1182187 [Hygrophoropsis aurantiaca]
MADNQNNAAQAEHLKAEGNTLHQQGKYKQAYAKYTEAIKLNGNNAIFYANRAASALFMQSFDDAASDAHKAVQLDPGYIKAWARLGKAQQARSRYLDSMNAYQSALDCMINIEPLSPAEQDIKIQCEGAIEACEDALDESVDSSSEVYSISKTARDIAKLPWMRACNLQQEVREAGNWRSCVWVVAMAYRDFKSGVQRMIAKQPSPLGDNFEDNSPLTLISDALLRDTRIFHIDTPDFFEYLDKQMMLESRTFGAWGKSSAKTVREEILKQINASGWAAAHAPLCATVRIWIIEGHLYRMGGRVAQSLDAHERAMDILEWGSSLWKDAPRGEKPVIFDDALIRGVKRLYAANLVNAYATKKLGTDTKTLLQKVKLTGEALVADVAAAGPVPTYQSEVVTPENDPGFISAFWYFPQGDGLSCIGYYHMQTGLEIVRAKGDKALAREHFTLAADYYMKSAEAFPLDDEKHPYFLKVALEAYWRRGTILETTFPLCKRIRNSLSDAASVWDAWLSSLHTQQFYKDVTYFEIGAQIAIKNGNVALRNVLTPEWLNDAPCLLPETDREIKLLLGHGGNCKESCLTRNDLENIFGVD